MKKKQLYKILDKLTDDIVRNDNGCTSGDKVTPKSIAVDLVFSAYYVLDRHYSPDKLYKEQTVFDLKQMLKALEEDVKNG